MKKYILNLTQHLATPSQREEGVWEPKRKQDVVRELTFQSLPDKSEIQRRAENLAYIAVLEWDDWIAENVQVSDQGEIISVAGEQTENLPKQYVMIGGAPYLMAPLEQKLKRDGMIPVYAFSKREVEETKLPDGSVEKKIVFKHLGFIQV